MKMTDFKSTLGIKTLGEDYFVMNDNSFWIVLDVEPIDFFDLKQEKRMKVISAFKDFLSFLPFNIEIAIRTCNENLDSRLNIIGSKISYNIKQRKDEKLLHGFENFFEKFTKYCKLNCPIMRKCYVAIPFNLPRMYLKPAQVQHYLNVLKEREKAVIDELSSSGLKKIVRLDKAKLEALFRSYVEDYVLVNNEYYLADQWQSLVSAHESDEHKSKSVVVAPKLQAQYDKVKSFIFERGVVYDNQLGEYMSNLKKEDAAAIIDSFKKDPDISETEHMYHSAPKSSTINDDMVKEIKNTQKMEVGSDHLKLGNFMTRGLVSVAFPNYLIVTFLKSVLLEKKNSTINLHIAPGSSTTIYVHLKRKLEDVERELNALHNQGLDSEELNLKKKEILYHLENIEKNNPHFFNFSLSVLLEGDNMEELNNMTSKIITMLHSSGVIAKVPINYQLEALQTAAPTGVDKLGRRTTATTSELLMHTFPFFSV